MTTGNEFYGPIEDSRVSRLSRLVAILDTIAERYVEFNLGMLYVPPSDDPRHEHTASVFEDYAEELAG